MILRSSGFEWSLFEPSHIGYGFNLPSRWCRLLRQPSFCPIASFDEVTRPMLYTGTSKETASHFHFVQRAKLESSAAPAQYLPDFFVDIDLQQRLPAAGMAKHNHMKTLHGDITVRPKTVDHYYWATLTVTIFLGVAPHNYSSLNDAFLSPPIQPYHRSN